MVTNTGDLDRCSKFIEEVRVLRLTKVKERQVRKFSNLIAKNNKTLDKNRPVSNNTRQATNASRDNIRQANIIVGSNNNRDNNAKDKWVINLSKDNLTQVQVSVYAKVLTFL